MRDLAEMGAAAGALLKERGERIAQGIFVKIERAEWNEVEKIDGASRGGFGSTGGYVSKLTTSN